MAALTIKQLPPCPGRTLVIGDVHGCAEELATLIEAFAPSSRDRLLSTGDLINRGPDSPAVLRLARQHRIQPVLGNHEIRLLRAWQSGNSSLLKSSDLPTFKALTPADWEWIAGWPHVLRIPSLKALVVHGGFLPGVPWEKQDPGTVTRIQVLDRRGAPAKRSECPSGKPWAASWAGPEHAYYGHTPRPHPLFHPHASGLDTGCVYGYSLTALSLPEAEIYRVHARRPYTHR
jgi:predicted phosphodiesterase